MIPSKGWSTTSQPLSWVNQLSWLHLEVLSQAVSLLSMWECPLALLNENPFPVPRGWSRWKQWKSQGQRLGQRVLPMKEERDNPPPTDPRRLDQCEPGEKCEMKNQKQVWDFIFAWNNGNRCKKTKDCRYRNRLKYLVKEFGDKTSHWKERENLYISLEWGAFLGSVASRIVVPSKKPFAVMLCMMNGLFVGLHTVAFSCILRWVVKVPTEKSDTSPRMSCKISFVKPFK